MFVDRRFLSASPLSPPVCPRQAYSQMFGISYGVVIPIFWAVYTLVVVFLERFVTPAVSVLTFFKVRVREEAWVFLFGG